MQKFNHSVLYTEKEMIDIAMKLLWITVISHPINKTVVVL